MKIPLSSFIFEKHIRLAMLVYDKNIFIFLNRLLNLPC